MTFYDITSNLLTIIGYTVLVYRIVFELQSGKLKKSRQEKLCTKWLIFTIFLKMEYGILAVVEIIPLGSLVLLTVKLLLFLPQNALSHTIYKKIQRHLEKVKLEEYNSRFAVVLSFVCTHTVGLLMKATKKMAAYINSKDIQEAQKHLLQILKIMEYKKAAVNMRHQTQASEVNAQLNNSEFNMSVVEDEPPRDPTPQSYKKSEISNRVSKILTDLDDDDERVKMNAEVMIVKPNKEKGLKAQYENVEIEYYYSTSKISFKNKLSAVQNGTLKEVKWITKNYMNIELVLKQGRSKVIRLKTDADVARWVEPVCMNITKLKEQQTQKKKTA